MPEVRVIPPVAERAHKLRVAAYADVYKRQEQTSCGNIIKRKIKNLKGK